MGISGLVFWVNKNQGSAGKCQIRKVEKLETHIGPCANSIIII